MSSEQQHGQEYGVSAGISLFHGLPTSKTSSNSEEKVHHQASPSNSAEHSKNIHGTPSSSSSSSNIKLVGSNRFFMPAKK